MNHDVPAHRDDTATFASEPMQLFEIDASADFAARPVRARPADRPRILAFSDEPTADALQLFEDEADTAPEGIKAKDQPAESERNGAEGTAPESTPERS